MNERPEKGRIARFRRLMRASGIESLLVTRREDVRYLSGFTGSSGSLLISSGKPCLITDFRYALQATRETFGLSVLIQKKDHISEVVDTVKRKGVEVLWFDGSSLTVECLTKFKKTGLKLREHRDLVKTLRQRKDQWELASIHTAVRRAELSFRELVSSIKPGVTEREIGLRLEYSIREKGSRKAAFDIIVASGENGALPHAIVTNRRIRKGDLVTIDFGAEANGYYSDMTRTYCVGRPSSRQRELHGLVLKAQTAALRGVQVGVACKSVDAAAREVIKDAGHGKHFGHGTGHGIGLLVHESPTVSSLSNDLVEKNMVFTIEPGVYIPGWGGVRIEDMVLVTEDGVKVLTSLPKELDALEKMERF